jgi:hypothetical protein
LTANFYIIAKRGMVVDLLVEATLVGMSGRLRNADGLDAGSVD